MERHKINWSHWFQLRSVKAWEACLLSLDLDPTRIPREFEIGFCKPTSNSYQIFNAVFPEAHNYKEYYRRLRLVSGFLEDTQTFVPISKVQDNKNLWEIRLSEFSAMAKRIKLVPLPDEMSSVAAPVAPPVRQVISQVACETDQPTTPIIQHPTRWADIAAEIGLKVQREKSKFTRDQIAKAVHEEMEKMQDAGIQGVTGRGGKIPSVESIRRHGLSGLNNKDKLAGITRQAREVLVNT